MKKNIFCYLIFAMLLQMLWQGCSKDLGNYDYNHINDITIRYDEDTFYVRQFDTLNIKPEVHQRIPNDASLKYQWYIYGGKIVKDEIILSNEHELNVPIPVVPYNIPYKLIFTVMDTITGVKTFHEFKVYVSNALSEGWIILEERPEGADLALIDPSGIVLRNVYSGANNGEFLPSGAHRVFSNKSITDQNNYVLLQDDMYLIDKFDFSYLGSYPDFFYEVPEVRNPQFAAFQTTLLLPPNLVINDGDFYTYNPLLGVGKLGARISGDYKLAPFMALGTSTYPCVVFDQKNHRFLYLASANATSLTAFIPTQTPVQPFDLNDIQRKLLVLDKGASNQATAIFKNYHNDSCFLYNINPSTTNHSLVATKYQPMHDCPDVHRAVGYAMSWSLPFIYYAVDNKVYLYDIGANNARLVYSFPAGENITSFQMEHVSVGFWIPATPNENKRLVIATRTGNSGSVYYLQLANTGDVENNTYTHKFEGFGPIKALAYKVRS
ncbi:MAG TPA: PKD-like family lipoprotein [Parasegetibacter sp.]